MTPGSSRPRLTSGLKRLPKSLGLAAIALLFGCSAEHEAPPNTLTGKVVIKGSNTLGEELAPALIAEYKKQQPGVAIALESKGSASGFAALLAGQCNIAAASRLASTNELQEAKSRRD